MPVIFIGLFLLAVLGLQTLAYRRLWDRGLEFKVRFSAKEAYEGDVLYLRQEVSNKKYLPMPWVHTHVLLHTALVCLDKEGNMLGQGGKGSELYSLMAYTAIRKRQNFRCAKRGVYTISEGRLRASDLLYFQDLQKSVSLKDTLTVFPKTLENSLELDLIFKQLDSSIAVQKITNPDPFEFRGIREYQLTDPLKSINHKASAVAQDLMVNIYAPTVSQRITLVLNLDSPGSWMNHDVYEDAIRLVATIAERYILQGASCSFVTNGRDCVTGLQLSVYGGTSDGHLYRINETLARVSLSYQVKPMTELMTEMNDREEVYVFVSPYKGEDFVAALEEMWERGIATILARCGSLPPKKTNQIV